MQLRQRLRAVLFLAALAVASPFAAVSDQLTGRNEARKLNTARVLYHQPKE
jgi:hypothetical protein